MGTVWHILRVTSGAEKSSARLLGFPAYVPHRLQKVVNRKHRRVSLRFLPALPGLVFVRLGELDNPRDLNTYLPGSRGWMRDGKRDYIRLSEQDFRDMRALEKNFWCREQQAPVDEMPLHHVGELVRFKDGSLFEGQEAIIERLAENRAFFRLLQNGLGVEANISDAVAA